MLVGNHYYHAKKRLEEIPLEYLYRLNVAVIRGNIWIWDASSDVRREHVEYIIGTLDDRDLAKQFHILRLGVQMKWSKRYVRTNLYVVGGIIHPQD